MLNIASYSIPEWYVKYSHLQSQNSMSIIVSYDVKHNQLQCQNIRSDIVSYNDKIVCQI
jgi:hypothetical protein